MSMKKKSAIAMPTATIVEMTITKKTTFERIIIGNKGREGFCNWHKDTL